MEQSQQPPPPDPAEEYMKKQVKDVGDKVRKLLTVKSDSQLASILRSSYTDALDAFEAGALPGNVARVTFNDFLLRLSTC